jgi:two-component system nitrate/nitrite response regulator NarL
MSMPIDLIVVDDHTLFRRGLVALLLQDGRFHVAGEAGDLNETERLLRAGAPGLLLLDIDLPGIRGVDAIAPLKRDYPDMRILMLTVSENPDDVFAALQNGADGYLLKTADSDELCEAIVKVYEGQPVVSPDMMQHLVSALRRSPAPQAGPDGRFSTGPLHEFGKQSPREKEIFLLISQSLSNKQIARALDIAEATVKVHVQHILKKMDFSSRVQIAIFAANHGLR